MHLRDIERLRDIESVYIPLRDIEVLEVIKRGINKYSIEDSRESRDWEMGILGIKREISRNMKSWTDIEDIFRNVILF